MQVHLLATAQHTKAPVFLPLCCIQEEATQDCLSESNMVLVCFRQSRLLMLGCACLLV